VLNVGGKKACVSAKNIIQGRSLGFLPFVGNPSREAVFQLLAKWGVTQCWWSTERGSLGLTALTLFPPVTVIAVSL
jgi:hypothetical protein